MEHLRRTSARREFQFVSLFANIGGFDMGAMRANGHTVLANDISPTALRIHRRNFPGVILDNQNVGAIASSAAATAAFLAKAGLYPGEPDCMAGGSPCNRFSSMSQHHGLSRSPLDTRRLLLDYADVIRHARPLTAIAENVAALAFRYPYYLENFLNRVRFDEDGSRKNYATYKVLCASNYGVAQIRRRTIVVVIRADVGAEIGITTDPAVAGIFPDPTTPVPPTVRWALQDLHQTRRHIETFLDPMARGRIADVVRRLPFEPDVVTRPFNVGLPRTSWYTLERCAWDKPAPTLTARGLMPIALSGALHPMRHGKFSIPEIMRLFGVPDDFDFGWATASEAAERLGLMIPPPFAEAIFSSLLQKVLRPYRARA